MAKSSTVCFNLSLIYPPSLQRKVIRSTTSSPPLNRLLPTIQVLHFLRISILNIYDEKTKTSKKIKNINIKLYTYDSKAISLVDIPKKRRKIKELKPIIFFNRQRSYISNLF